MSSWPTFLVLIAIVVMLMGITCGLRDIQKELDMQTMIFAAAMPRSADVTRDANGDLWITNYTANASLEDIETWREDKRE